MNPDLAALFQQHRTAVLGVAGAGVVGLALLRKKKTAAGAPAAASPAGTMPAAAVIPSSGVQASYPNTSGTDIYNSLQQILAQQANATSAGTSTTLTAPKPIASTLFAPQGTGQYVVTSDNTTAEVQSDGSLFGLTLPQWRALQAAGTAKTPSANVGAVPYYDTAKNVASAVKPATV